MLTSVYCELIHLDVLAATLFDVAPIGKPSE